jgi:hypothetical protein
VIEVNIRIQEGLRGHRGRHQAGIIQFTCARREWVAGAEPKEETCINTSPVIYRMAPTRPSNSGPSEEASEERETLCVHVWATEYPYVPTIIPLPPCLCIATTKSTLLFTTSPEHYFLNGGKDDCTGDCTGTHMGGPDRVPRINIRGTESHSE